MNRMGRRGSATISQPAHHSAKKATSKHTTNKYKKGTRKLSLPDKVKSFLNRSSKGEQSNVQLVKMTPLHARSVAPIAATLYINAPGIMPHQAVQITGAFSLHLSSGVTLNFNQAGQLEGGFYQPPVYTFAQPFYGIPVNAVPSWGFALPNDPSRESVSSTATSKSKAPAKHKVKTPSTPRTPNQKNLAAKKQNNRARSEMPAELKAKIEARAEKIAAQERKNTQRTTSSVATTTVTRPAKTSSSASSAYSHKMKTLSTSQPDPQPLQTGYREEIQSAPPKKQPPKRPPVSDALRQALAAKKATAKDVRQTANIPAPPPPPPLQSKRKRAQAEKTNTESASMPVPPPSVHPSAPTEKKEGVRRASSVPESVPETVVRPSAEQLQEEIARRKRNKKTAGHEAGNKQKVQTSKPVSSQDELLSELERGIKARRESMKYDEEEGVNEGVNDGIDAERNEEGGSSSSYTLDRSALNRSIESFDKNQLKKVQNKSRSAESASKRNIAGGINFSSPVIDEMLTRAKKNDSDDEKGTSAEFD